ncbi:alpha/beta fold hydrolase [Algoriphagus sp. CAU 1675]|uniref:S9 family peptidase n=1 Tax=Algoriphagus sp. CAU 1675 TaxID=3032597 RepID=UPI0023D9C21C|nr:alpha/beta fold hydrolase [Algoriphagus sp. CAU 1675]MDF2156472.1 alpha/beta fold hydrolase [Algoriphagus sp. CAU 1675]
MKKFFKVIGFLFLGIFSLVIILVAYLSFAGFPKPGSLEVKNIDKVSFGQVSDFMNLMSYQNVFYELIRTEGEQVIFRKNGQTISLNTEDKQVSPFEGHVPMVGMLGQLQFRDGFYYFLDENRSTEDRILMKMEEATGTIDTLITGHGGLYDIAISRDGTHILAADEDQQTGKHFVYRLAADKNATPEVMLENAELLSLQDFDLERNTLVMNEVLVSNSYTPLELDLKNKTIRKTAYAADSLTYQQSNPSILLFDVQVYTKDFTTTYFLRVGSEGLSKEFNTLFAMQHDSVWQVSPPMAADVHHLALSPDEKYLVFSANAGGFGKIFALDRRTNQLQTVYDQLDFALNWLTKNPFLVTEDNQVVFAVRNYSGGKILVHDLKTGEQQTVDESIHEQQKDALEFTAFTYPTSDDSIGVRADIPAYLYKPLQSEYEKIPVIISLHGGPDMPAFPYAIDLGNYFINHGIAVIAPDYRGSSGYGVGFAEADNFDQRTKQVEDIKYLLEWIKSQPDLDGDRVLLMGQSHGGYLVMATLAQFPGEFLGGVSVAGVSDFSLVMHENNFHSRWYKHEFGDFTDPVKKPIIDGLSPLTHAANITEPLFLMHGTADPRVVYQNSDKMAEAIKSAGGQVRYIKANGAGHGVEPDGPLAGLYMIGATMDFIEGLMEK